MNTEAAVKPLGPNGPSCVRISSTMRESSHEKRMLRILRALLVALAVAALSPLLVTAVLIIYVSVRYTGKTGQPARSGESTGRSSVKTMSEVMESLRAIPFRSRLPRSVATVLLAVTDIIPVLLDTVSATAGTVYPYPEPFEPVLIESQDDTPICGLLALQPGEEQRPAILFVHGLFGNKNRRGIQAMALRAYYRWGFHVFAVDLRNSGDSSRFSEAPTSWGFRESGDVLAAAEYLDSIEQVSTVAACGVSMGAASVLIAAGRSRLDRPLSGGVVAINPYADAARVVERVSSFPRFSVERFAIWITFRSLLLLRTLAGGPRPIADLRIYGREVASQYYEISEEDLYRKASPVKVMGELEVPCLVIHATDDPVVPVGEAEDLLAAAVDNPMVDFMITPTGGHALYQVTSPRWFYRVLEMFFSYWGEFGGGETSSQEGINSMGMFGNPDN